MKLAFLLPTYIEDIAMGAQRSYTARYNQLGVNFVEGEKNFQVPMPGKIS